MNILLSIISSTILIIISIFVLAIITAIILAIIDRITNTKNVKEVIYEHGMEFYTQHKFLLWTWYVKFAWGGSFSKDGSVKDSMGKVIETRYKTY